MGGLATYIKEIITSDVKTMIYPHWIYSIAGNNDSSRVELKLPKTPCGSALNRRFLPNQAVQALRIFFLAKKCQFHTGRTTRWLSVSLILPIGRHGTLLWTSVDQFLWTNCSSSSSTWLGKRCWNGRMAVLCHMLICQITGEFTVRECFHPMAAGLPNQENV